MAQDAWPRYFSSDLQKTVRAARIVAVDARGIVGAGEDLKTLVFVDPGDGSRESFVPNEPEILKHAEIGGYAVCSDDGGDDWIVPRGSFEEGYRPYTGDRPASPPVAPPIAPPIGPLLISRENPNGWKLEDLLHQVQVELGMINDRLMADRNPYARAMRDSNNRVIALLKTGEAHQRAGRAVLDEMGPGSGGLT